MLQKLLWPVHNVGAIALAPVAIALLYALLRRASLHEAMERHRAKLRLAVLLLGLGVAVFFLLADVATIPYQRMFQDDESAILSVAAAYVHGQPMYPAPDAPAEYGILYGPATFLVFAVPAALHAESLVWYQAWVALALAAAFGLAYLTFRRVSSTPIAALALGYAVSVLGLKAANEWSNKGDPWALLFVALAFWSALALPPGWAGLLVALCGACLISLKVTLVPLALLPLVLVWRRDGRSLLRQWPAVALLGVLSLCPFVLPGISLAHYRTELAFAARQGFSSALFHLNLVVFVRALVFPLAAAWWYLYRTNREAARRFVRHHAVFLLLLACASVTAIVTGAKNGAGDWHLMPLAIPAGLLVAEALQQAQRTASATPRSAGVAAMRLAPALWIFGALALHGLERTLSAVDTRRHYADGSSDIRATDVRNDMLQVAAAHPHDTLQVGAGASSDSHATWFRYIYLVRGEPLFLDSNTRIERDEAGVPVSAAVLHALADCRISLWLIPRNAVPFDTEIATTAARAGTTHLRDPNLYPVAFQEVFRANYFHAGTSRFFDLWACRRMPGRSSDQ